MKKSEKHALERSKEVLYVLLPDIFTEEIPNAALDRCDEYAHLRKRWAVQFLMCEAPAMVAVRTFFLWGYQLFYKSGRIVKSKYFDKRDYAYAQFMRDYNVEYYIDLTVDQKQDSIKGLRRELRDFFHDPKNWRD